MRKVFIFILLMAVLNVRGAKLKGFYVTPNFDTVEALFKVPLDRSGLNLIKLTNGISYYKDSTGKGRPVKLKPEDVILVKIFKRAKGSYSLYPLNKTLVQCVIKGELSYYMSEYRGIVNSAIFGKRKAKLAVYYFVLNKGERRYLDGGYGMLARNFWVDYLGKDYPEFVDCFTWSKSKRKEMRMLGEVCPLKDKDVETVIAMFNKWYAEKH